MESLKSFPSSNQKRFDPETYNLVVQQSVINNGVVGEIGIELEMEGLGLIARSKTNVNGVGWTIHAEGSLRNGGQEYVLTAPCPRGDVEPLLSGLFKEFHEAKTALNLTSRCSTHIHLNANGMKVNQIASLVTLWGVLEDALVNWCGEKRAGNLFCLRFSDCAMAADTWGNAFKTGVFRFGDAYRYLALNANALNKFGSLEFRTLRGADNPELVIKWVDCLLRLKDLAMTRWPNPADIAGAFSGLGPIGFITEVLEGLPILDEILATNELMGEDIDRLLWEGLRRVQPIMYVLPWHEVVEESNKVFVPNPFASEKPKVKAGVRIDHVRDAVRRAEEEIEAARRARVREDEEDVEPEDEDDLDMPFGEPEDEEEEPDF